MKKLYSTILLLFNFSLLASAQDSNVTVIGSGDGNSKTNAVNQALRNCIEKSMGAFLSSSTTISNDSLIKDEIVSIASGNIVSYDVLSELNKNENWNVTVSAIISPEKLITTLKSKGFNFELNGGVYAQNILKEKFYAEQEKPAFENFLATWENVPLFDFNVDLLEPKVISEYCFNNGAGVPSADALKNKRNEAHNYTLENYKSNSIQQPSKILGYFMDAHNDQDFYQFDFVKENRFGRQLPSDGYAMIAIYSPKIRKEYIQMVKSFLNLLSSISIKDIDSYKTLNNKYLKVYIPTETIGGMDVSKFKKEMNNQGNESVVFYLRNNTNRDIFERINRMVLNKTSGVDITYSNLASLKTSPQLFSDHDYNFISIGAFNGDNTLKSVVVYPFFSKNIYAGDQSFSSPPFYAFRPKVLAIYLTIDELQVLKKVEFKNKYTNSEMVEEKLNESSNKNNKKEEFNLYLKNFSDSINSTIKDKNDWIYLYDAVQTKPVIGDTAKFVKYASTQRYPSEAKKNNTTGKVLVSFITEKDGSVSNTKIYKGIGSGCDEEAIRFISSMPKRIPAQQDGKPVRVITIGAFNCEPPKQ